MPVRWGVLSTARINRRFLAGARESDEVEVVAVASRDAGAAARFAAEHGIARAHGSYEALLCDPEVEAVYIPLPNSLHVEWSELALRAGKHVLCEKPLSRDPEAVERAFAVAEAEGRLLMEGFMFRHHPQMRRLAELVGVAGGGPSAGPGTIGRLRMIRAAFSFPLADPGNIRLAGALDGGALMDVGCYCVSAARLLAGEPRRVYAERALGGEDVDLTFSATMRFDADVLAHFDAGIALAPRSELEVVGEEGSLWLPDPWHGQEPVIEWRGGEGHTERIEVERASSFRLEVENFSAAIRGQGEPLLGREDALAQARALHALALSAAEHQPVGLLG